ncbi:bicyclomycin resistance protein [Aquincola sp. S2]|uniref:Bicyclomycin resistance protein n=1 Tax=Pseudaquabacterium terrae TaxID=2732868 RepID=A0ABX2EKR0_9BURK|nr:ABC transporter substrate-binding protein [Aquabacterium terrae]NRF69255.1 bicyclomycin resistance protein [Aquabacterium terrae]
MRRLMLALLAVLGAAAANAGEAAAAPGPKILRVAFAAAETSLDPAKIVDSYSRALTAHIFEAPYRYDHLARPYRIKPNLADGMPEVSPDFKVWTVKLRRGIRFADDPAFKGQPRELVAQDVVYSMKRIFDPAVKSPVVGGMLSTGFVGLKALRDDAIEQKKPFDYDREVEGMKALDRYTVRFTLETPRPRLIETLAAPDLFGAVAREVVEHYGSEIDAHPVGTGPFRLKQWRRSSLIVLERNPQFREELYDGEPAADDAEAQALLQQFKGRRLPLVDEVHVAIINESQPRWLSFLNGQVDLLAPQANAVPSDFFGIAMPRGKLAPNLAKQGIIGKLNVNADSGLTFFNMEHPLIGGYAPEKVALRRAISLAYDVRREIQLARRGAAVPAQSPVVPHTSGYDPAFKSEMSDFDPARARALLDLYGYLDRDADGWRELPDGSALQLEMATQPEQRNRTFDELWKKAMDKVGLRIRFVTGEWPENLKAARAGKLMMWQLGSSATSPDGQQALARLYGPETGSQNMSRFKLPAFDRLYERMQQLPDGPEREALFLEAKRLAVAYMPWKFHVHRLEADVWHPWVIGFRRPLFWYEWWHFVDIDDSKRKPH